MYEYRFSTFFFTSWRKLNNEELHNLYSSPIINGKIKSRRMRWARHVGHIGGGGECM
jgi:hypothetical protein